MAHESLTKLADDSKIGAAVFLSFDFSKAYDKVNHSVLLEKVLGMEFPTGFALLLKSYLKQRYTNACVCVVFRAI